MTFNPSRVPVPVAGHEDDENGGQDFRRPADECVFPCLIRISLNLSCSRKQDLSSADHEDHQAQFYECYRKVAEEYDKEFLKKYDEDLTTTLIFVSRVWVELLWARANQRNRLVYFPLSPPHSSSRLTPSYSPTRAMRLQPSFVFSSTRSTTPRSETTFPPSRNGPALRARWSMSRLSSSRVSPLHFSPPSLQCSASNG